jgi:adenylate cyclase
VADLTEILLSTYGARAVGLDIVFPEPGEALGDARIASMATHAPLTLAQIFDYTPHSPAILQEMLAGGLSRQQATGSAGRVIAYGYIANHAGLASARCVGNIGYMPDPDGVLRHLPASTQYHGSKYSNFASTLLACADPLTKMPSGNQQGL